ncbi:MAG: TetR/AcrR family transcriptional regulator [Balneolaceae bacterium]|nr:TetR/AcrR family transcriptional regulator [Balneolaceae bacterium]
MGTSERKEREKERKKAMMLEAAEKVILEKGLDQLNMDEVASRAEVSKGSLYLYFKNKTELVLGICEKASKLFAEEASKVLTKNLPGIELVVMLGQSFLNFVREHPEYFRSMKFFDNLKESEALADSEYIVRCQDNIQNSFTCMVRAIQIGMQDGSINDDYDPRELAVLLWGTSDGIVNLAYMQQNCPHYELMQDHQISLESVFENYIKLIGGGIATDGKKNKKINDS